VTISGFSFGASRGTGTIMLNNSGSSLENLCASFSSWSDTQVVCITAPNQAPLNGQGFFQLTRSDDIASQWFSISYSPPSISSISPRNGPTAGNVPITLTGSNFGLTYTVKVGTQDVSQFTTREQTSCVFTLPAGCGPQTVVLQSSNQTSSISFAYQPPSITSTVPDMAQMATQMSTDGSTALTIHGSNFGAEAAHFGVASISLGAFLSCAIQIRDHDKIVCLPSPGSGSQFGSLITTSGSTSFSFTYAAPVVTAVSADGALASGLVISNVNYRGNQSLTLTGTNFGPELQTPGSGARLTVTIDGAECTNPEFTTLHSVLKCTIPAGYGYNLALVLSRGIQRFATSTFSYRGPLITAGTLTQVGEAPQISNGVASVVGLSTSGGLLVQFGGVNFVMDNQPSDVRVFYGPSYNLTQYECIISNAAWVTDTSIQCAVSSGVGKELKFQVHIDGVRSPVSADHFSYPVPTIDEYSFWQVEFDYAAGNTLFATSSAGELIMFNGTNFGTDPSQISVSYGVWSCSVYTVTDQTVLCKTSPGVGENLAFRISVGKGASAYVITPNATYSYPGSPELYTVSGCAANTTTATSLCPTEGSRPSAPVILTLSGKGFAKFPTITVGGRVCTLVSSQVTVLTCELPPGIGLEQPVTVKQGGYFSRPLPYVSYAPPSITSTTGCSTVSPWTTNCDRLGHSITIHGMNFGSSGAKVVVAGVPCTSVVHNASLPHRVLVCNAPEGVGLRRSVLLFQDQGQPSATSAVISYEQCPLGTYVQGLGCEPCAPGNYSTLENQDFCFECPAGRFQRESGKSFCDPCPVGRSAQVVGLSECHICKAGKFSNAPGAVTCLDCAAGSYSNVDGASECNSCLAGEYQPDPGATICVDCAVGFISTQQQPTCQACPGGYIAATTGSNTCVKCHAGTRSNEASNSTSCVPCLPGTYNPADAQSSCSECAPGRFSKDPSANQCQECEMGKFANISGQSICSECSPGFYTLGRGSMRCEQCSPGSYSSSDAAFSCTPCPRGQYQPSFGSSSCLVCPIGSFQSSISQARCDECPIGEFSSSPNSVACTRCPAGFYNSASNSTACLACPPGQYSQLTAMDRCLSCVSGTYSPAYNSTLCLNCVAGKFARTNGMSQCESCPAGTYSLQKAAECLKCEAGRYSGADSSTTCTDCAAGHEQPASGASDCVECQPGFIAATPATKSCSPCLTGTFVNTTKAIACENCVPGKYNALNSGATACLDCLAGSATNLYSSASCPSCSAGSYTNTDGSQACIGCTSGHYQSSPNKQKCDPCPVGQYVAGSKASSCFRCDVGTYQNETGSNSCNPCPLGTFAITQGLSICALCDPGYFTRTQKQEKCTPCEAGRYAPARGSQVCIQCEPGKYQPSPGASACRVCEAGKFTESASSVSCTACPAGRFQPLNNSNSCNLCSPGSYSEYSPNGITNCAACELGHVAPNSAAVSCVSCGVGFFIDAPGEKVCRACSQGEYQFKTGQSICLKCDAGTANPNNGASSCTQCSIGRYANTTGHPECVTCPPGTYQPGVRSTSCLSCPAGKYQGRRGQTECIDVQPGSYTATPSSEYPVDCPTGTFQVDGGRSFCNNCTVGYISASPRSIICVACDAGRFAGVRRSSQCTECPSGFYQGSQGASACDACPPTQYQSKSRSTACANCESGKYTNTSANTACIPCQPGKFQISTASSHCLDCTAGTYSVSGGSTACANCAPGQYSNGSVPCADCTTGHYQPAPGQSDCLPCQPGYAQGGSRATLCTPCTAGYMAPMNGSSLCTACSEGFFQNSLAQTHCMQCENGTYAEATGATICDLCAAGTWSSGAIPCTLCEAGKYQNSRRGSSCLECGVGQFQTNPGADRCISCSEGKIAAHNGSAICDNCASGTFQALPGQSVCIRCEVGSYSITEGQSFCQTCEVGTFSDGLQSCTQCDPGSFQSLPGQSICIGCDPGYFQNTRGKSFCERCRAGQFSPTNFTQTCRDCPQGTFQSLDGSIACLPCEAGSYSPGEGASACLVCEAGKAGNGSDICRSCDPGYYSDTPKLSVCKICFPGRYSAAGALECTRCDLRGAAPDPGMETCLPCPDGAYSSDDRTKCICSKGLYGATVNVSGIQTLSCLPCPRGALCDRAGLTVETMQSVEGYWRSGNQSLEYQRCLLPTHCASGTAACVGHRTGPICSLCETGYRSQTATGECQLCPTRSVGMAVSVVLCIVIALAIFVLFWIILRADKGLADEMERLDRLALDWDQYGTDLEVKRVRVEDEEEEGEGHLLMAYQKKDTGLNITAKIKILITFLQISMNMAFALDVDWPPTYASFIAAFSFVNLDFVPWQSVGCVTLMSFFVKYYIILVLPIVAVSAILLIFLVPSYYIDKKNAGDDWELLRLARKRSRRKFWKLVLFSAFAMYPNLSSSVLSYFVCREIGGKRLLLADVNVECGGTEYHANMALAIIAIIAYPLGIPAFIFYTLRRYRKRLHEPGVRLQLGFLYHAFTPESWYFELCDMANKLIMVALLAFLPSDNQMQAGMVICCLFTILLLWRPPYNHINDFRLHLLVESVIFLIVAAAYTMTESDMRGYDESTDVFLSSVFIIETVVIIIAFLVLAIKHLFTLLRTVNWRVLRVHLCWMLCRRDLSDTLPPEDDSDDEYEGEGETDKEIELAALGEGAEPVSPRNKPSRGSRSNLSIFKTSHVQEKQVELSLGGFINPLIADENGEPKSEASSPRSRTRSRLASQSDADEGLDWEDPFELDGKENSPEFKPASAQARISALMGDAEDFEMEVADEEPSPSQQPQQQQPEEVQGEDLDGNASSSPVQSDLEENMEGEASAEHPGSSEA